MSFGGEGALERIMPQSLEAERSVLSCCMQSDRALVQVTAFLTSDDFYHPMYKRLYECVLDLYMASRPVDPLTLAEQLETAQLEQLGGLAELQRLSDAAPLISNAMDYAHIVHEKAMTRRLILAMDEVMRRCYEQREQASALLDFASSKIYEIRENRETSGLESIREIVSRTINEISALSMGEASKRSIKTGFPSIDRVLGGLGRGTLNIVASRPGMGKSALAFNIAYNAARLEDMSVAIFSLEMAKEEIASRLLSAIATVDSRLLRRGQLGDRDWDQLQPAVSELYNTKIFIDDSAGTSPLEMLSRCRQLKYEHRLGLVVVDYLQLLTVKGRSENRQQEISEISRSLKLMARELDVPVLALSQLSRAVEQRGDKRPMMSDLRDSGSIEQDADTVSFLYRPQYYEKEPSGQSIEEAELNIAKNRAGSTESIRLGWLPSYTLFVDTEQAALQAPPERAPSMDYPDMAEIVSYQEDVPWQDPENDF